MACDVELNMHQNNIRRRAVRPLVMGIVVALTLAGCSNREEKLAEAIATANDL